MSKLFVRERRQVGQGAGQPRFRIVASEGLDMRVYVPHMRRVELEQLAAASGADIVYLGRGEQEEANGNTPGGHGRGRGRRRGGGGQGGGHARGQGPQMQDQD